MQSKSTVSPQNCPLGSTPLPTAAGGLVQAVGPRAWDTLELILGLRRHSRRLGTHSQPQLAVGRNLIPEKGETHV